MSGTRQIVTASLLLATLASVAGCGAPAGSTSCAITDNGDGTRTVTCPDGSSITVASGASGELCTVTEEADGSRTIACSDGTVVRLDAGGRPIFPGGGALAGVVKLFGAEDHAGTQVLVPALGQRAVTDVQGWWRLDGLPAGFHELSFEHEGFAPVVLPDLAAIGEPREVPTVVLRRGVQLLDDPRADTMIVSPAGDAALFFGGPDGLVLWEQGTQRATRLSEGFATGEFSEDGKSVALVEADATGSSWELSLVDRATGRVTLVASGVEGWQWGGSGAVLAALDNSGSELQLVVFEVAGAVRHVVSRPVDASSYELSDDGAYTLTLEADGRLLLHELATGRDDLLAELPPWKGLRPSRLLPHGGGVLVVTDVGGDGTHEVHLIELPGRTSRLLASETYPPISHAPDGRSVVMTDAVTGWLLLWDARRGEVSGFGEGRRLGWAFSPDGTKLLLDLARWSDVVPPELVDLEQGQLRRVCPVGANSSDVFFLDDQAICFRDGSDTNRLWELATDEVFELGRHRYLYPITGPDPDLIAWIEEAPAGNSVSLFSRSAGSARLLGNGRVGSDVVFDPRGGALHSLRPPALVRISLPGGEVEELPVPTDSSLYFPRTGSSVLVLGCSAPCADGYRLSQHFPGAAVMAIDDHVREVVAGDGFVAYLVGGGPGRSGGFVAPLLDR